MSDPSTTLNGAESLVTTLATSGVSLCLANPGTSEMHFVAALDRIPGLRCVLGLFEGVVTGAADAYYRMAGTPAATLMHLGPGLGNGLANLHNARKAGSGIVNIVGDHAHEHLRFESLLKADVQGIARTVSHWVRSSASAADVGIDGAAAVVASRDGALGRIATLILPADTAWSAGGRAASAAPALPPLQALGAVPAAARLLRQLGPRAVLLLGQGGSRSAAALHLANAIAAHTGCRVLAEFYNARMPGGRGAPAIDRLPYAVDAAVARLAGTDALVLAGAAEPIGFFAYPGKPSQLKPPGAALLTLAEPQHDVLAALQALANELGAAPVALPAVAAAAAWPSGALTPEGIAAVVAATLPEQAVVVDEAVSSGRAFGPLMRQAAPHDWLPTMGGAIGFGLPGGVGAALGAPGRPVLGACRALGRACVEAANGLSLGAKHSHACRHGAHSQRRLSPFSASTRRAGASFGAIRRCRLVVGGHPTPRRRLGWHRNSPRRRPDPKPDRLLVLEGDGSAMYTVQALWTMARESLPVVVLVFANRTYRILQGELQGVGATISGDKAAAMLSLGQPSLDWVALARGHGLPGVRVDNHDALAKALRDGFASGGACLIEALL